MLHKIKNLYQRYMYGAGCCDLWSLDYFLAKKLSKIMKRFKDNKNGYPMEVTLEEYDIILDKIIWAFEQKCSDEYFDNSTKEYHDRVQEGLELFGKHFSSLWY